jgi:hypothetical protein
MCQQIAEENKEKPKIEMITKSKVAKEEEKTTKSKLNEGGWNMAE